MLIITIFDSAGGLIVPKEQTTSLLFSFCITQRVGYFFSRITHPQIITFTRLRHRLPRTNMTATAANILKIPSKVYTIIFESVVPHAETDKELDVVAVVFTFAVAPNRSIERSCSSCSGDVQSRDAQARRAPPYCVGGVPSSTQS